VGKFLEAGDGVEAMAVLQDQWIDLILADINMPNMNGIELLEAVKKDAFLKSVQVVMVTTEGSHQRIEQAESMGAAGYITKPFTPNDIKENLKRIMGESDNGPDTDFDDDEGFDF
jgi:two-component system, chemotaxis family, chemotaxis protein CheY